MNAPIYDLTASTDKSIRVYWNPIVSDLDTGAVPITSYSLEWDQANGNWQSVVGNPIDFVAINFTIVNSVVPGQSYKLRLRARNVYGWGPYSS